MGLRDLQLIFDNPHCTYVSGQAVSGRLRVSIDETKKLRSIIVKFKGEANCSWSEKESVVRDGEREENTIYYRDSDLYFENSVKVFGGTGNSTVLLPGEHFFQFSMTLPDHLPSSFEGKYGHIRYTVKAILDRPWRFNHEVMAAFTVISHMDLNLEPRNRNPFQMEDTTNFCCCCCRSGPLTLVASIPVRGYVPGQSIPITVEVDNTSNVRVSQVICELQKIVKYYSSSPRGTKQDSVSAMALKFNGSVGGNASKTWTEYLRVPPLPPSMPRECSIITLEYKLFVKAVPDGLHQDLVISFPIVIGTVPLWQNTHPSAPPMAPGFGQAPQVGTNFAPNPYLPPPSYEESVFGTTNINDSSDNQYMYGTMQYNPRYPTYALPLNPTFPLPPSKG